MQNLVGNPNARDLNPYYAPHATMNDKRLLGEKKKNAVGINEI